MASAACGSSEVTSLCPESVSSTPRSLSCLSPGAKPRGAEPQHSVITGVIHGRGSTAGSGPTAAESSLDQGSTPKTTLHLSPSPQRTCCLRCVPPPPSRALAFCLSLQLSCRAQSTGLAVRTGWAEPGRSSTSLTSALHRPQPGARHRASPAARAPSARGTPALGNPTLCAAPPGLPPRPIW